MGSRGPVPHRSEVRRRSSSGPERARLVRVPSPAAVEVPEADAGWHPLAAEWFSSLSVSAQSSLFQPSDWAQARVWAELLSRQLVSSRPSAQMVAAWASGAGELLTTEGARRRVQIEVGKLGGVDEDEAAAVAALTGYRARLGDAS